MPNIAAIMKNEATNPCKFSNGIAFKTTITPARTAEDTIIIFLQPIFLIALPKTNAMIASAVPKAAITHPIHSLPKTEVKVEKANACLYEILDMKYIIS